jgi:hypothetical protein
MPVHDDSKSAPSRKAGVCSLANFQAVFGNLTGEDARPTLWRSHPQMKLQNSLFNFFAPSTSLCYSSRMQNRENEVSKVVGGASGGVNPERWVDDHGNCLYRYALLRVRHPEVAEDLVQETLCAAVRVYQDFQGRSSERSWLCGILKNKICDHFRKHG